MCTDKRSEFQTFVNQMRDTIEARSGKKTEIQVITKNNDSKFHGLVIKDGESNLLPIIYLEEYFEKYGREDFQGAVQEVLKTYEKYRVPEKVDSSFLFDYEQIKGSLRLRLVNYKKNEASLVKIPHYRFLDLAIVPILTLKSHGKEKGAIAISDECLNLWQVSAEEVLQTAEENQKGEECFLESVDSPEKASDSKMFVMSNKSRFNGAVAMLNKEALKKLAETVEKEYLIILPFNIHEVYILPDMVESIGELRETVKEANVRLIPQDEFLSDNVYIYSREREEIGIG